MIPILSLVFLSSCIKEEIDEENLYTFTDKLAGQYIESDTTLSEFNILLKKSGVKSLLNSYGSFTCFVPDNTALRAFYKQKGKKSSDEFPVDSIKLLVYDHIINGSILNFASFPDGMLFQTTMSDRNLTIRFDKEGAAYVNDSSRIIMKDFLVHNGIIHRISRVLDPVRKGLAEVIAKDTTFSIFYEALVSTGLVDSILKVKDDSYVMTTAQATLLEDAVKTTISSERHAPYVRKFGYTLMMENNQTLRNNGINNFEDLKKKAAEIYDEIYPDDQHISKITDRKNSLNRFIAYHMINKKLSRTKFIMNYDTKHMSGTIDMYEYVETMCPNTLLEVSTKRSSGETNIFNYLSSTGQAVRIKTFDKIAENGIFHEIDNLLVYSKEVEASISSKRLRLDIASFFPELTNNDMRGRPSDDNANLYRNALPKGYLERLDCSDQTVICYSNAHDKLMNFEGDELFITVQSGRLYNFKLLTPPVPAGTYEVRFGFQANGRRGVAQFYFDGEPCGVPVNLNNVGTNVMIGYQTPGSNPDDLTGFENDKMMRNRGFMKGPNCFKAVNEAWYTGVSARYNASNLRKILGTYSFPETGQHELMVKGLSAGQFQLDFIEFVPVSLLESEDIN
jgi:uncharacterized surface protein with fasciclin (FAS1) repeats